MQIRPMVPEDWPRVAEIFGQGIDDGNATMHPHVPSYAQWDEQREKAGRLVAVLEGQVVGWTALTRVSARACYAGVMELAIYVDRAARGTGVGTALLKALIQESERLGIWTLEAHIFAENIASRTLHQKCGFREVGVRERIGRDGRGAWRSTVIVERRSRAVEGGE